LTISLTFKEIKRKRLLVSKFKEDAINHIEIQELVNIFGKGETYSRRRGRGRGRKWYDGICNIITNLPSF
jgi:hypothetical protein